MATNSVTSLQTQLSVARKEIQNLRKQIRALSHVHQTDMKVMKNLLTDFKCTGCKERSRSELLPPATNGDSLLKKNSVELQPIAVIRTDFPNKRAVPRQPTLCSQLLGCIELNKDVFNNPEHSLDGLSDFSHLWIIYHFHKNESHAKAKVAPPRLGGERVGIFSTRSPHRPCPIGLSLVEIVRIDGRLIYFHGTDMVDGTPVFDIKPYIPRYDNPMYNGLESRSASAEDDEQIMDTREEPDGEETMAVNRNTSSSSQSTSVLSSIPMLSTGSSSLVKVPNWILNDATLQVSFNDRANQQMADLEINRTNIVDVLKNDPRSVYLRTRYGSQIFTFQLGEVTVTCRFDDANAQVTVIQVRKSEHLSNESSPSTN